MSFLEDLMKSQAGNSMKQEKTESATKIDQPENRTMKSKTAESREAAPPPAPGFSITNETPKRLTLLGSNGRKLILSPLERTANLGAQVRDDFDFARLEQANEIRVSLVEASTRIEDVLPIIITILFLEFFFSGVIRGLGKFADQWYWKGFVPLTLGIAMLALLSGRVRTNVQRILGQTISLICVVGMGVGLPAAIIFSCGDVAPALAKDGLFNPQTNIFNIFQNLPDEHRLLYVGRTLQLIFIAITALLPSLLYFLFDRQFLGAMRDRFEQAIFRLDPNMKTLTDIRSKYGRQIEKVYGLERLRDSKVRLIPGTRIPILLTTIVMVLGWLVALQPISGTPGTPKMLTDFFKPQDNVFVYGFLGAYVFTLYDLIRRYVRGDLKPKAYSSVVTRVLVVAILSWVLSNLQIPKVANVVAFMVGIFPESFLTYLREFCRKYLPGVESADPLTKIEGIEIYDRSRLLDEGVTNIESLAHHDFVDLIIETRIPVPRLVDWVDQAILYLHTKDPQDSAKAEAKDSEYCGRLRSFGIRTATDLLRAQAEAKNRNELEQFYKTLGTGSSDNAVARIQVIIDALEDDEWLDHVRHWRSCVIVEEETREIPAPTPVPQTAVATAPTAQIAVATVAR